MAPTSLEEKLRTLKARLETAKNDVIVTQEACRAAIAARAQVRMAPPHFLEVSCPKCRAPIGDKCSFFWGLWTIKPHNARELKSYDVNLEEYNSKRAPLQLVASDAYCAHGVAERAYEKAQSDVRAASRTEWSVKVGHVSDRNKAPTQTEMRGGVAQDRKEEELMNEEEKWRVECKHAIEGSWKPDCLRAANGPRVAKAMALPVLKALESAVAMAEEALNRAKTVNAAAVVDYRDHRRPTAGVREVPCLMCKAVPGAPCTKYGRLRPNAHDVRMKDASAKQPQDSWMKKHKALEAATTDTWKDREKAEAAYRKATVALTDARRFVEFTQLVKDMDPAKVFIAVRKRREAGFQNRYELVEARNTLVIGPGKKLRQHELQHMIDRGFQVSVVDVSVMQPQALGPWGVPYGA